MLVQLLLFIVGFVFGRFWFGVILLPIIYGIPRAAVWAFRGNVAPRAILFYVRPVVLWSFVFLAAAVLLTFVSPDLASSLVGSRVLAVAQFFGIGAGVAQMLSTSGRRDLDSDFRRGIAKYARSVLPGTELKAFFLAAATSYFLFEDRAAALAAVLATAVGGEVARDEMLAILLAIAQGPDTLALFFAAAAARSGAPPVPEFAGSALRRRAEELAAQLAAFDGNVTGLRQRLAAEAPTYERELRGSRPNPAVFPRLNQAAMVPLNVLYS